MTTADPVISVRDLWKVFGPKADRVPTDSALTALSRRDLLSRTGCTAAVREVTFDVAPGEVFVVMGLSGSGKSTLVRCLTRLIEPTAGDVMFEGENITTATGSRMRELRRRKFAMVFQHFGLLPHRRVIDNVAFGLEIRGIGRAARRRRAAEVVELVGLAGYENSFPDQLSGGMQQRVGLARALAVDPDVMLFDEPFSALDPLIRRDMQQEVIRLHSEVGKTMVFITHDLSEALKLGDRILIMRDGDMVQVGTGDELVGAPVDDYVADFVRDVARANVLTLRWIMRSPRPDDPLDGPELAPDVVIREATRAVLAAEKPVKVVENGELLGVVGDEEILAVIAAQEPAAIRVSADPPVAAGPGHRPLADDPLVDGFVADDSVADDPATEGPLVDDPLEDKPVADHPVADGPVADNPLADDPATADPVAADPVAAGPAADGPVVDSRLVDDPVAADGPADGPVVDSPLVDDPAADDLVSDDRPAAEETEPGTTNETAETKETEAESDAARKSAP